MSKTYGLLIFATLAVSVPACSSARILSHYASHIGARGGTRTGPHAGVDFGGEPGAPVLAAADGTVYYTDTKGPGCGIGVLISHPEFNRWKVYCHLSEISVELGQPVQRGEMIGRMGMSGNSYLVLHVHMELCTSPCFWGHSDGNLAGTEDPWRISDGCFDPNKTYPRDHLVLTHPIQCK